MRTMAACQQMDKNVVSPNRMKHAKEEIGDGVNDAQKSPV